MVELLLLKDINKEDIHQAAQVLFNAFVDYPIYKHMLPNDVQRRKRLYFFFQNIAKYAAHYGQIVRTSANYEGVMLLLRPPAFPISVRRLIWYGALFYPFKMGIPFIFKLIKFGDDIDKMHINCLKGDHLYLWMLVIAPRHQGQKFGKKLIEFFIDHQKTLRIPGYLETAEEKNIHIYEKYGFRLCESKKLPKSEVWNYSMIRNI
jgi:GNAT superfamily N-acetyltransferase